jgi:hypothetical protein
VISLLRRLLADPFASPGGVREDHIAADDRLLSILGSRDTSAVDAASDPLVRLLLSWRADIDGVPFRAGA